ncbi:MAG: tetratricopeptide repeat protein [Taibaiella sp.]|nr:tetratricopeptide repeat protein [Taibaiella sp.]
MKRILIILLTISCSLLTIHCSAQKQGQEKIDSMLADIPKQKEDTNNVILEYSLSGAYSVVNPDEGIKYGRQALALSTKLGWEKGLAWAYNALGNNYLAKDEYQKALEYYIIASKAFEKTGEKKGIAAVICNIGVIYRIQGDYPKALEYLFKALKLDEEGGYKKFAGVAAASIATVYSIMKDYPNELKYRLMSLEYYKEAKDKGGIAYATGNIGITYCDRLEDYPKALEYFLKALELSEEGGNRANTVQITSNIGNAYENQKNYIQAAEYFHRAAKLAEEFGSKDYIGNCLRCIGSLYITMAMDSALEEHMSMSASIKPVKNSEPTLGKYKPHVLIPRTKAALISAGIEYLERGMAGGRDFAAANDLSSGHRLLGNAYRLKGDYKKAYEAYALYYASRDSLFSQENKEEILKMGMKNDYDRQRLADSLKVAEREKIAAINLQKQKSYKYMGIAGILLLMGFSFFIVKERGKSEAARKQSDGLLLNILPEEVAQELKSTGTTTAKHYDNVTVLFTDFVNFTQAGENMSPQNLIDELHTCFKAFDEITGKYNIEKIKTIGDAYLAVCGLPTADVKHAENIVKAAKEITMFMEDRLGKMGVERTFQVRIGIHSGSVVAGIVGVKKFAYDIWGDTVNTAARMEQSSEEGKINISETTYALVKDKFNCEYRGEVKVKGKGVMKMYFVG